MGFFINCEVEQKIEVLLYTNVDIWANTSSIPHKHAITTGPRPYFELLLGFSGVAVIFAYLCLSVKIWVVGELQHIVEHENNHGSLVMLCCRCLIWHSCVRMRYTKNAIEVPKPYVYIYVCNHVITTKATTIWYVGIRTMWVLFRF